jgi:S1-C subfamily serine protease
VLLAAGILSGLFGSGATAAGGLPEWAARARCGTVLVEAEARGERRVGSGFFLEAPGFIATALHTIEGARRVRVTIPGSYAASDARLLAASSTWDLAILSVTWPSEVVYPGLTLDSGPSLPPGTEVAVTGYLQVIGSDSRVSQTIRGIVSGRIEHRGGFSYLLDLHARPGLSGSPVYRTDSGLVVAMLTSVHGAEGIGPGGATPIKAIMEMMEEMKKSKQYKQ